jgi:hypothetical protein
LEAISPTLPKQPERKFREDGTVSQRKKSGIAQKKDKNIGSFGQGN